MGRIADGVSKRMAVRVTVLLPLSRARRSEGSTKSGTTSADLCRSDHSTKRLYEAFPFARVIDCRCFASASV